jgi:hypothetical protein
MKKIFIAAATILMTTFLAASGCSKPGATISTTGYSETDTTYPPDTTPTLEPLSGGGMPYPGLPVDFPQQLRWLTDEEKARITEIALSTPKAQEWLQKENQYTMRIGWIAIFTDPESLSGYQVFDYDIVAKGIPRGTIKATDSSGFEFTAIGIPNSAEIYPYIIIHFGPDTWTVCVAVDVETWNVTYEQDYPHRTGPTHTTTNG